MPNHVTNRVSFYGEKSEIQRLLEAVKADNIGLGSIDFNKVIFRPDSENIQKHGFSSWYDWSIANWGTKWNSYGYDNFNRSENSDTIYFQTAWSAPHPIMEKLSEMFPAVKINHEWADEDIGNNCGRKVYYGGKRVETYYPESYKDSYEFAAEVMDIDLETDLNLYLNASETEYISIKDDDNYERIELFGKPALFTYSRITDEDVPKGMYCYHIRHGDDRNFCALEKYVSVNHAGSVVLKEPLDLGKEGYITLTNDNTPNFLGETMSLYDFRESNGAAEDILDLTEEQNNIRK